MTAHSSSLPWNAFLRLWFGQLVSSVGTGMTGFALGVWWYLETDSASVFSSLILAGFLPGLILKPLGGVLADRHDRRKLMMLADLVAACSVAALAVILWLGYRELWLALSLLSLTSTTTAIHHPAYKALVSDLVAVADYQKTAGLIQLAQGAQFLVSPLIAGAILQPLGVIPVLVLDCASFLFAIAATAFTPRSKEECQKKIPGNKASASIGTEIQAAWLLLANNAALIQLILTTTLICFLLGFVQTLLPLLLLDLISPAQTGLLQSLMACGLILGSALIGAKKIGISRQAMLWSALWMTGLSLVGIATTTSVILIAITGALFFSSLPFAQTAIDVLIRTAIPNQFQGRVWALIGFATQLGYPLAYATAGPLADRIFKPMLAFNGPLASTLGNLFGTGASRGIGLLLGICGISICAVAIAIARSTSLHTLEHAGPNC